MYNYKCGRLIVLGMPLESICVGDKSKDGVYRKVIYRMIGGYN